ncbi:MAG: formimidoylglutamase [Acidobacteria bacterium]|nr:formimidoylglutamase [Acidobacteriota bacterium]
MRLLGAHTYATSVSPRSSASTPAAVRAALARYSTWSFEDQVDLADAVVVEDRGDVAQPDTEEGAGELARELDDDRDGVPLWVLLGGDNALTWRAMTALSRGRLADWGLITFDAHLDMREGRSNGSPVRQLLESGLDGGHVVQIGLADFSNSAAYAGEAAAAGVRLVARSELRRRRLEEVVAEAVAIAGDGGRRVYVDVDMDVCDRAVVPGCPAAAPGGINADELRQLVRLTCADPRVAAIDVTEIDVARDAPDERTVRLGALVVLEALTGYLRRPSDQRSAE